MRLLTKRAFILFLCLVFFLSSFSVPRYAYADSANGEIQIKTPNNFCYIGETIGIEVNDPDFNTDPVVQENVTVKVSSTSKIEEQVHLLAEIDVDLQETDSNSGQFVGKVRISATSGSAIELKEIIGEVSGTITATYHDNGQDKSASITVEDAMLQGCVSDPGGIPANAGMIEVVKISDNQPPEYITSYPINLDGTYKIPRLPEGKYNIRANYGESTEFMRSMWHEIKVAADGTCSDPENPVLTTVNFNFQNVQLSGTVADKDSTALQNGEFVIEIRSMDNNIGHNLHFDCASNEGAFRVAGLSDGEYAIKAVSKKAGNADSYELRFSIVNNAIQGPPNPFQLQLTQAQLSGVVKRMDGTQDPVPYTNVNVLDSVGNYLWSTQTDATGAFAIGGLETGSYKIQANNMGMPGYIPFNQENITVNVDHKADPEFAELFLQKHELKLKWVEPFAMNYSNISIHLDNTSLLNNNWSGLTATITGNGLSAPIILNNAMRGQGGGEEVVFLFYIDQSVRSNLTFGRYTVEIKNNGVTLPFENNQLDIIQELQLRPDVAELSQYQQGTTNFQLDVVQYDMVKRYPWTMEEQLTVKVFGQNVEHTDTNAENIVTVTVPSDNILPLSLSAHSGTVAGRRDIEVYRGTQLIARGGFDVGISSIGYVTANEGSDEAILRGEYLGSYPTYQTRAELWLGSQKLANSKNTNVEGDVRFRFDYTFEPGVEYTLKVFINDVQKTLPEGGLFKAVPCLDWFTADFTSDPNKYFIVSESSIAEYGWSSTDNISVRLNGLGIWDYMESKGVNLEVYDQNLAFRITGGPGRVFPLPMGEYYLEVYKDNKLIGFTNVIAAYNASDVLCGTVKTSEGPNADGGYINVSKEGDNWGERLPIGLDGRFYAFKNRLRGNGRYYLTAVPSESSSDAPTRVIVDVANDDFSTGVTINLNKTQIKGTVYAGTSAVNGGLVDVYDPSQDGERVLSAPISPDGTYKLGGLVSGRKYNLIANGPWEVNYLSSKSMEITCPDSLMTEINLDLVPPQITGIAKDFSHNDLVNGEYNINIRQLDNQDSPTSTKSVGENFLIGHLKPGNYAVSIEPRGSSVFARSYETFVTIDQNGVASPDNFILELAQTMLTGKVYDKDGNPVTTDGYVEVWEDRLDGSGYIYSTPLINGNYNVGGLPEGNYLIRAGASDYTELYNSNSMSYFEKVTIGKTVVTKDLSLTDRIIPRIMWVNDAQRGNDRITARILNFKKLDMNNLEAEILNVNGSQLNPALHISNDKIKLAWRNYDSDEADLELYIEDNLQVNPGDYLLKLSYKGTPVLNDQEGANLFGVSYYLCVLPKGVLPEATPGMTLKVYVDDLQGGPMPNLWSSDDTMTVKLIASDGKEYSNLPCIKNADHSLTTTIPGELEGGKLSDGWTSVELYKGTERLAYGNLQVGIPVFDKLDYMNEGDNTVTLWGDYLASYDDPSTSAEILDDSDHVLWRSNDVNFWEDRLEFYFDNTRLPFGRYQFKMISDGTVITTLPLYVSPPLICQPHAIALGSSGQIMVKNSAASELFRWNATDSISDFMVRIGGPAHRYDIDSGNGLSFEGDSLKVMIKGQDGEALLSQSGEGWLEVYKEDRRLGFCRFTIGLDAITATVKAPGGELLPNARVRITNLQQNDNESIEVKTDSDGSFYLSKQDLPRRDDSNLSGYYSFLVMPPIGSGYATTLFVQNIDAETNNNFELIMAQPQINGEVHANGEKVSGGMIEVQKVEYDQWKYMFDFPLNSDGIFNIGGLDEGTYYLKAHEDDQNKDYVSSDFMEVHVIGTTIANITLDLNPVQISGDALSPSGEPLQGDQYFVSCRPLDQENKDIRGEWRAEDGTYRIGALKPGRYAICLRPSRNIIYTQSKEIIITVKEDGTVENQNLPFVLTEKMLDGTVSADTQPFNEGYVDVFNGSWQRLNYVTTVELDDNGNFRIGGIPKGTYFIRAAIWNESQFRETYSQSVMTEVYIEDGTEVQLSLVDNRLPRIRSIDAAGINDDRINVQIVNRSIITDTSKLQAQIFDLNNNPVGEPIVGADYFFLDGWYDSDKDEGNLWIRIDGNILLAPGKYNLKLFYDNEELVNETPYVDGFHGFYIVHNLDISPYAAVPEETGDKVLRLGIYTDDDEYQWPDADRVVVRMYYADGSPVTLEETIAADNTITVTLPNQNLAYGSYPIMVYVDGQLLARSDFIVGYPKAEGVGDITEEQSDIHVYGQNLIIYFDEATKAEIYDSTGKLLMTCDDPQFMYDDIVFNLKDRTLATGFYKMKLYDKNGQAIILPNGGSFKCVDILAATPSYYLTNTTMNKTVVLESADGGNAPWNSEDTLRIRIHKDWSNDEDDLVISPVTGDVTDTSVTFTLNQNIDYSGHCSITIYKLDGDGSEIYVGYAHLYLSTNEQLTGTILDENGVPVPYGYVYLKNKNDDGWSAGFDADGNGDFGIYELDPGEYTMYAGSPKGKTFIDSDGIDIIIDNDGNCNIATHDFTLKAGRKISGTIHLPAGVKAPINGLWGWVSARSDNDTTENLDDDQYFGREFWFQEGTNTTDYSIIVPIDHEDYYVQTYCQGLGMVNTQNFYSADNGSVNTIAEADLVNITSNDRDNIDMYLRQGKAISGTVLLPSGKAPEGGMDVTVQVYDDMDTDNPKDDIHGDISVTIPENESSIDYTINVPSSDDYTVEYKIDPKYQYLDNGFYQSGSTTAYDRNQATSVDGTSDQTGIDMTLIPAKFIKGTISIPQGYQMPDGGVSGFIAALIGTGTEDVSNEQWRGTGFGILDGTSTEYTIAVPADWNNISIDLWSNAPGLVSCTTFYSDEGSVFDQESATEVNFDPGDETEFDITLAVGNLISGDITLPAPAPEGGQEITVQAFMDNGTLENKNDDIVADYVVSVAQGQSTGHYELCLPAGSDYRVKYESDSSYPYMGEGYYSTAGTIMDKDNASLIDITSEDKTDIDLTVIEARMIKGTITVPTGFVVPEGGINGWILAKTGSATEDKSDDFTFGNAFKIEKGFTKYVYTIAVPKEMNNFIVELWSDGLGLVDCGTYYSKGGNVFNQSRAFIHTFSNNSEITGVDITLEVGKTIAGTITLPQAAPQGGREMRVYAIMDNGTTAKNDDILAGYVVSMTQGQIRGTYKMDVPAMNGYKVLYVSDPAYLYEDNGYYSTKGTVFDNDLGTVINATSDIPGIDLTVSPIMKPVCIKAEVSVDGTSVQLSFNKALDPDKLPLAPAGFSLTVGGTSYEIDGVTLNDKGTMLTLHLKDYKIFKDYKDINVTYDVAAGIVAYDGMKLDGFNILVANNSTKEFSILTNFIPGLLNKIAVINVAAEGEEIVITDKGTSIQTGTGKASVTISGEGSHEVEVSVAGRKQKISYNFTVDLTPPEVTITNPAKATMVKNNHDGIIPVITFSADSVTSTRMISLNGGTLSATTSNGGLTYTGDPIREAGHYVLTATAKDAAGNIKTVSSTFDIVWDNSSPVIEVNGVINGGIYENATISVSLGSSALPENSNQAKYSYKSSLKLPDGTVRTGTNSIPALEGPGTYRLEIVATNPGYTDITSSKVVDFIIDNTAPVASVGGVANNAIYKYAVTPILSFTDDVTSQQILLTNAVVTLTRGGANVDYHVGDTISMDGEYVLTAKTKDSINHSSNAVTKSFTIDKTKPVISMSGILNGATFKDQNVTLTIKTNEGTLTVTDGSGNPVTLTGSQHTFTGTANQVVTYKLIAKAVDAAGNSSEQQLSFSIDRLAVNIVVNGVTEGMLTNTSPDISFTTLEGTQEKQGTRVTIDGNAFTGGRYSVVGTHTLVAKYVSGNATYTKTLHFTIDNTVPAVSVTGVLKNATVTSANIIAKAGDTITVRAKVTDLNGVGDVALTIGTANIWMNYVTDGDYYEGKYIVESGNFDSLSITVSAKDKAGNSSSQSYSKALIIDNTKPLVSLYTNPAIADGNNGIFKSPATKVTLVAGENDTINWNLNGSAGTAVGNKELTPSQGTNVLVYYAKDQAGNVSDEKVYVFAFDSVRPADVTLSSTADVTTSVEYARISGTVTGEGSTTGTKVLLIKSSEIVAKASIKAGGTFDFDGIKLTEGRNTFDITAIDLAGNQSQNAVTLTRTLDSTVPVLQLGKTDDTHYTITSNENITKPIVKFNGDAVSPEYVTAVPADQHKIYHVTTPQPVEGTNVLNVTALDEVGNMGTGSFTNTYLPPHTAQDDLPLNDNATMDIPDDAFDTNTQILVKTVNVNGITNYKPLGAAISFEFKDDQGEQIEPTTPLLIKNYIGVGLNGVVLMHVKDGVVDKTLTAEVITDAEYKAIINNLKVDVPYYVIDTGYLIFMTTNFSSYQVAQDNIAPVLTITTSDYVINNADKTAGGMKIEGIITDTDPEVAITQVLVDGVSMNISSIAADNLDESFSIALNLTDGEHEVTIKASDAAGNTTTVIRNYQVKITSPSLTAVAATLNTNRNSVDLSINTGENAQIFINGVSKGHMNGGGILVFDLIDNAVNNIYVKAIDTFGNTTEAPVIRVTRDSTAPEIIIDGVSNGGVYGYDVPIEVRATDDHKPNTSITMDGSSYSPAKFSTEGQHTLVVSSTDTYGNTATRTVVFTIDKSVPVIHVTGAANDGKYAIDKTLNVTADNVDELIITKATDNQTPVNMNASVTGTSASANVSLGTVGEQHSYTIEITAKKTVGGQLRKAYSTIILTVDRKNPVITSTTTLQTENSMINLTGTVDEAANIYLNNDLKITANPAGSFSITGQNLALGSNTFDIKAIDAVGNETSLKINVNRTQPVNNGGNPGGGNPGGGNPGGGNPGGGYPGGTPGGVVPSENNKDDEVKPETPTQTDTSDTKIPENKIQTISEKPVIKGSIATATTTEEELNAAIAHTKEDSNGIKSVKIELQKVTGTKTYTEVLPISAMKTGGAYLNILMVTPLGTVKVPGNMFTSKDMREKSTLGISMALADKSKLDKATLKAIGSKPILQLSATLDGKSVNWSNPNAPVTIAIPYKPTAAELKNPDHIVVWYIDSKGKVQTIANGRYDAKTGTVTFTTTHFSIYAIAYVKKSFKDISKLDVKTEIEFVASKGIMNGKTDTLFDPNSKVTRGDFIAYLVNTLSLTAEVKTNFADVKVSNSNYHAIGTALELGIISGTSKSKLNPNNLITKEEMAIYTASAMKLSQKTLKSAFRKDLSSFSDASKVSTKAVSCIAKLIKSGILKIDGKQINAKGNLTRAEVAEILYNVYKAE